MNLQRISETGYVIPDCDDIPGVDLKTGAGNTQLELEAQRNHLDGKFTQDQLVLYDLHKGWFGANPNQFEDEFWADANVTIGKIDKIDDETGYQESGQINVVVNPVDWRIFSRFHSVPIL